MDRPHIEELDPATDPWTVGRKLSHWPGLLFFDSADRSSPFGEYSYVTAGPRSGVRFTVGQDADPFALLKGLLPDIRTEAVPDLPPFQGGVAGLFGYGLGRAIERLPQPPYNEFPTPDLAINAYDWVVSFDHVQNRAWLVSHADEETTRSVRSAILSQAMPPSRQCIVPSSRQPARSHSLPGHTGVFTNFTRAEYQAAVAKAVEYIHAGDCFQVNISQRLLTPLDESPLELYGRLRTRNRAPFAAYFDLGDAVVCSASPERFVRLLPDGSVTTRPIKGTRRRGRAPEEDFALTADLLASAKDRAENVMIVDLMRNDLGRVCDFGSVEVASICRLETYPTVHHLVSEVRGRLRDGLGPIDLLRATFPGGSVTGAPKIRAMEIISELEQVARGPYCGCLGWIGYDGAMDTSILIRTFTASGGWLQFSVGGGIVADSDPAREYEETLYKAEGLLRALNV